MRGIDILDLLHGLREERGAVSAVLSAPAERYTRALLAAVPRVDARRGSRARAAAARSFSTPAGLPGSAPQTPAGLEGCRAPRFAAGGVRVAPNARRFTPS
ncbi:hypothetical protein J7E94_02225 [Streptomyces sp. ISL-94]|nr:hypothetical protein [Streptomyces sp. ISL-94]